MYDIHTYDNGMEINIDADGDYRIIVGDNFVQHGVFTSLQSSFESFKAGLPNDDFC